MMSAGDDPVFIKQRVFNDRVFAYLGIGEDDRIADDRSFSDLDVTAKDRIDDGAFDGRTVRDEGIADVRGLTIDGRRGVLGDCIDWPRRTEQTVEMLPFEDFEGIIHIMFEGIEATGIAVVDFAFNLINAFDRGPINQATQMEVGVLREELMDHVREDGAVNDDNAHGSKAWSFDGAIVLTDVLDISKAVK